MSRRARDFDFNSEEAKKCEKTGIQFMLDPEPKLQSMQEFMAVIATDMENIKKGLKPRDDQDGEGTEANASHGQDGAAAKLKTQDEMARISSLERDLKKASAKLNDLFLKQKPLLKEIDELQKPQNSDATTDENVEKLNAVKLQLVELKSMGKSLKNTLGHFDVEVLQMAYNSVEFSHRMMQKMRTTHLEQMKKNPPSRLVDPLLDEGFLDALRIQDKQEAVGNLQVVLNGAKKELKELFDKNEDALKQIEKLQEKKDALDHDQDAVCGTKDHKQ